MIERYKIVQVNDKDEWFIIDTELLNKENPFINPVMDFPLRESVASLISLALNINDMSLMETK